MDVVQAIKDRRSIRKFKDREVTREQVNLLLEAARLAPSGLNAQPWRFGVVRKKEDIKWLAREASKGQRWLAGAGAVFVCCADLSRYVEDAQNNVRFLKDSGVLPPEMVEGIQEYVRKARDAKPELIRGAAAANCSIALTQMMLQAVEAGLGTCWVGMFDESAVKERFAIADNLAVIALLAVGYPDESPGPRPRKSLEEIVLF